MKKLVRTILLFEGRTGSSVFGDALNQNPKVSFLGEDVAHLREDGWASQQQWIESLFWKTASFPDRRVKRGIKAVGFKVKLREIADPPGLRDLIEQHRIKIIHMTRDNLIKQVISSIRAIDLYKATGKYNLRRKDESLRPGPSVIPLDRFRETLKWLEESVDSLREFVATLTVPVHETAYEDLQNDIDATVRSALEFLKIPHVTVKPRLIKLTDDKLDQAVVNYEEIKDYLARTKYAAAI
jgi:LPS sulfotransferase NodH